MGVAVALLILCAGLSTGWAGVQGDGITKDNRLFEMSIEELMSLQVTSVGKKEQTLSESAAAVFVITNEDIRRSGATSIPELLRMVPGMQVSRFTASMWEVSARGFKNYSANKLLVLIDGRTVYSPAFSGVYWDVQDVPLQDVDRIEVIRGPGATLWGANAVNGVINILTKNSKDTQGTFMEAGAGTEERGFGTVRYGGKVNDRMYYRAYAKYLDRDEAVFADGDQAYDEWQQFRAGFRTDFESHENNRFTVQGDAYSGDNGGTATLPELPPIYSSIQNASVKSKGFNMLGRWEHVFDNASDLSLRIYYERTDLDSPIFEEKRDTIDMDFQHRFSPLDSHEMVGGVGYRFSKDRIHNTFAVSFDPSSRGDSLWSGFLQDEISMANDTIRLTLGSKFEYNDYTGFEVQPGVRFLYKQCDRGSFWASVSRSVRTPSRAESDAHLNLSVIPPGEYVPGMPAILVMADGSDDFESEEMWAFELGYRRLLTDNLSIDAAAFYNIYDRLFTSEPKSSYFDPTLFPKIVVPFVVDNNMDGHSYGFELALDCLYSDLLNLKASYSYLKVELSLDKNSLDPLAETVEDVSPRHQISLRPSINLRNDLDLDLWARYVSRIPDQNIHSYITLDIRIAWRPLDNIELSLVGQNLLDPQRRESGKNNYLPVSSTEVQRSVYGKIAWTF